MLLLLALFGDSDSKNPVKFRSFFAIQDEAAGGIHGPDWWITQMVDVWLEDLMQ